MTEEEYEKAHQILETHFNLEVGNADILNAWKLFKQDYCKQLLENKENDFDYKKFKSEKISLQSQLDIANKKLDKIDTFIRGHQLFGMRFAKTLYRECLEYILSIIGDKINNEWDD